MKKKQVWRYYCDFCKKAGCSAYHLRNHETHCTLNPNRVCRMCFMLDQKQPKLADLIALMPATVVIRTEWGSESIEFKSLPEAEAAFVKVREAAGNCPACILSALRQAKIPAPMMEGFDYAKEGNSIRADYYEAQNTDLYEYA